MALEPRKKVRSPHEPPRLLSQERRPSKPASEERVTFARLILLQRFLIECGCLLVVGRRIRSAIFYITKLGFSDPGPSSQAVRGVIAGLGETFHHELLSCRRYGSIDDFSLQHLQKGLCSCEECARAIQRTVPGIKDSQSSIVPDPRPNKTRHRVRVQSVCQRCSRKLLPNTSRCSRSDSQI